MSEPKHRCRNPTCRYELPSASAKFCPECGTPEPHPPLCINPTCRLELPSATSKFCPECGREQQISVAHKETAESTEDDTTTAPDLSLQGKETGEAKTDAIAVPEKTISSVPEHAVQSQADVPSAKEDPTVYVTFHVLVPWAMWGWIPGQTKLQMYFGHKALGNWATSVGNFDSRDLGGGMHDMFCTVSMPHSIINEQCPIPYKYGVIGYQSDDVMSHLESFPNPFGNNMNRCLLICELKGNKYIQFDTIAYPEMTTRSGIKKRLKGILFTADENVMILGSEPMRRKCLLSYLDRAKKQMIDSSNCNVEEVIGHIDNVFQCLYIQRIFHASARQCRVWADEKFPLIFLKDWIMPIVEDLKIKPVSNAHENGRRLFSVVTLLCCVHKMMNSEQHSSIPNTVLISLLEMFSIVPDLESKHCWDFELMKSSIADHVLDHTTKIVYAIASYLVQHGALNCGVWLHCLPLIHLLLKEIEPFEEIELPPDKLIFDTKLENVPHVYDETAYAAKYFLALKPLFIVDHLLMQAFICMCPLNEACHLIHCVPLHMYIAWITKLTLNKGKTKSKADQILGLIEEAITEIQTAPVHFRPMFTLDSIIMLLWSFKDSFCERNDEQHVALHQSTISLLFYVAVQSRTVSSNMDELQMKVIMAFERAKQYFSEWIGFGCFRNGFMTEDIAIHNELKFWVSLLDISCPHEFLRQWHNMILDIVEQLVSKLDSEEKFQLFCAVLQVQDFAIPDVLQSIISTHVMESLKAVTAEVWSKSITRMELMCGGPDPKAAQQITKIFMTLLKLKYPNQVKVSFEEVLDWTLWPALIKISEIIGDQIQVSEECKQLCNCATSKSRMIWKKIGSGSVKILKLQKYSRKQIHLERLCAAVVDGKLVVSKQAVQQCLSQRIQQMEGCLAYHNQMKLLFTFLPMTVKDVCILQESLDFDLTKRTITSLCLTRDDTTEYNCFKPNLPSHTKIDLSNLLAPLVKIAPQLSILFQNEIFSQLWNEQIKAARPLNILSLCQVVWPAVVKRSQWLIDSLHSRELQVYDIEKYLLVYTTFEMLHRVLLDLFNKLKHCTNEHQDESWIKNVVEVILSYESVKQTSRLIKVFCAIRLKLNLTGNFEQVEILANKLDTVNTLEAVAGLAVDAKSFLANTHLDQQIIESLEYFVGCLELIHWIREETEDIGDLTNFVNVSLSTSVGEGDLGSDRLSALSIVGEGYRSLIYDLKSDAGFVALLEHCATLGQAIGSNPSLPLLLKDCSAVLEWYKSVKQQQHKVEATVIDQMKTILQHGHYTVDAQCDGDIGDLIWADVDMHDTGSKHINLDELKDIESKLILTTGSKSENRQEVETFLDVLHRVFRIAHILLELQQTGNVKYFNWKAVIPCSLNKVDKLQHITASLEDELLKWKKEVAKNCHTYYELNNYTTSQLLYLRRQIGNLKAGANAPISYKALMLLNSISYAVTPSNVKQTVQNCLMEQKAFKNDIKGSTPKQGVWETEKHCDNSGLKDDEDCIEISMVSKNKSVYDEKTLLSLEELGVILKRISLAAITTKRPFSKELKCGSPNLVITNPENVLKTVLSLYMEEPSLQLPTMEEVLVCSKETTEEEVVLLWRRAVCDPAFLRIFCLVHAEKLSYQVCDAALSALSEISQGKSGYRLVIICSNKDEGRSQIVSKLHLYRRQYTITQSISKYADYLKCHFTEIEANMQYKGLLARDSDFEKSSVRIVKSKMSGMGKSLYIDTMVKDLKKMKPNGPYLITIPIHGPAVTADDVLNIMEGHFESSYSAIIHFDIAPRIFSQVDTLLFSLLVLRGLHDSRGRVWRCHCSQLYAVEVTIPVHLTNCGVELPTLSFLEILPSIECSSPRDVLQDGTKSLGKVLMNEDEFRSNCYQLVYQYLRCHSVHLNLDTFTYKSGTVEGTPTECLQMILNYCGTLNPSWLEIKYFVKFLEVQFRSCEESVFCDVRNVGDVMRGLKDFVVKFMIQMSRDFATPSLQGIEEGSGREGLNNGTEDAVLQEHQISTRRQWEQCPHPYIFFNQDRTSITFVGFSVNKTTGDLINPSTGGVLEKSIMTPHLYSGLELNAVNFNENYATWGFNKAIMVQKLGVVLALKKHHDPDPSYVLTVDNFIKILAIQMRFRCGIPVVLMGETGCGKTRLIRYMCNLTAQGISKNTMFVLKLHGGTTETDVTKAVEQAQAQAAINAQHQLDTVLFFDEANTSEAIGLIKEVMCDRRLNGQPLSQEVKFIAACNPYRRHSENMIRKLESAGLGFYVKASETQDKLGNIPLRQLVYRVLDLPPSMKPLVYDFGQLNTANEKDYVTQIVTNHLGQIGLHQYVRPVAQVLAWSQAYMRKREDECSYVSLRDVERSMIVFEYFVMKKDIMEPLIKDKAKTETDKKGAILCQPLDNDITRSLVLALSVCYHARLQEREEYEKEVCKQFTHPLILPGGVQQFRAEITWCQGVVLDAMTLGPNIAKNSALRENVFMMTICIELRIPLFIVGKPGSSKSLAKSVLASSLQGKASKSALLRSFKQVHLFSYQCSQLSTSDSILDIFNTASRFQQNRDVTDFVSVVVLDEVGLAEDSPNLPLKALHPLLEDGTVGADGSEKFVDRERRVAFIGISNWSLDPAKMNRGVMVTRGEPSVGELNLSASGICSNDANNLVRIKIEPLFTPLAEAYLAICKKQKKEFFGLRDYYSLIKMLYEICSISHHPPTWPSLEFAIRRNFSGLDEFDPIDEFRSRIVLPEHVDLTNVPSELHSIVMPNCSHTELVKSSLQVNEKHFGENRYLLFLTENYAALQVLNHYLKVNVDTSNMQSGMNTGDRAVEPFVLFGSSFPKDKDFTQVYRNINQIKICMETGRTVILMNLGNLYESLYDVLNQYYVYHGGQRYVDLGLQTHRIKCRVHSNFKLILIAEKSTVYETFPTPLINRLEKHFVLTSSVLNEWQKEVLTEFDAWIQTFCFVQDITQSNTFGRGDAFVGYQADTPAAVVFQAVHQVKPSVIPELDEKEGLDHLKDSVLKQCKWLLLQTASPAALVRLEKSALQDVHEFREIYFKHQHHSSLVDYLVDQLAHPTHTGGLLLQVTTNSHLLNTYDVESIAVHLNLEPSHVSCFTLLEFDTELDFCYKIRPSFMRQGETPYDILLIIQCESGQEYGDLIACARYRIYDERAKAIQMSQENRSGGGFTHVLFIIHLPPQAVESSSIGFQGDPWICAHIDDIHEAGLYQIHLEQALNSSISEIFIPCMQYVRLHYCIQAAASKLMDAARGLQCVSLLLDLIPNDSKLEPTTFYAALVNSIQAVLQQRDTLPQNGKGWVLKEALDPRHLQHSGTLNNALIRKVDEVVIHIFSEVIANCDRNYNLNLLHTHGENSSIGKFWMSMFQHGLKLNYEDMTTKTKQDLPSSFECRMPFSWLIREAVDTACHTVFSQAGLSEQHKLVCSLVSKNPVGVVLGEVDAKDSIELFQLYTYDFLRSMHRCCQQTTILSTMEYKIIADALCAMISSTDFCMVNNQTSLINRICALHFVYGMNRRQILLFGQLTLQIPSILSSIYENYTAERWIETGQEGLCMAALHETLQYLEPPLENSTTLQQWVQNVGQSKNTIEAMMLLLSNPAPLMRHQWLLILALKLFVEYLTIKYADTLPFAKRLYLLLQRQNGNFQDATTIENVKSVLKLMEEEFKMRLKRNKSELDAFKMDTENVFIEIISQLCFGGYGDPKEAVIKTLFSTIFLDKSSTDVIDPETYTIPAIHSFLLKLLMDHNSEQVKTYLQGYLQKLKRGCTTAEQNVCLMTMQCLEDSTYKELVEHQSLSDDSSHSDISMALTSAQKALEDQHGFEIVSVKLLEGIAKLRCGFLMLANMLHKDAANPVIAPQLMNIAKLLCTNANLNRVTPTEWTGPAAFLVKTIVRLYGLDCLKKVIMNYPWVLPSTLNIQESKVMDQFAIYGSAYSSVRSLVIATISEKDARKLSKVIKDKHQVPFLVFSIYEVITLSRANPKDIRQPLPDELAELDKAINDCSHLKQEPNWTHAARALLGNQQGGPFLNLRVAPDQPMLWMSLTTLIVHVKTVLFAKKAVNILSPFVAMLTNSSTLVNSYLPTMPEDYLPDFRAAFTYRGRFYECPNGHPYLVTECGRPMQKYTCPICGSPIGGEDHNLDKTNRDAASGDQTKPGHILGAADVSTAVGPERTLSPSACCIIRALMHCALLWAYCNNEGTHPGLVQLIKPSLPPQHIPEFLFKHLEKDIAQLAVSLGKSIDEAILTIHILLRGILLQKDCTRSSSLTSKAERADWERIFGAYYIQPILQGLDQSIQNAMTLLLNDKKDQGDAVLQNTVYERVKGNNATIEQHLWTSRPRISLEYLGQVLQVNEEHRLLQAFIQEEKNLRATQYLPDIVLLQEYLYEKYNTCISREEASQMTISELEKKTDASMLAQLQKMITSLSKAWELVHEKLSDHTRLRVDTKYLIPAISKNTKLECILPTTTGPGICTTSLVDFLVCTHNDFIEKCASKTKWSAQKIPITHINQCHVLDYEHQLVPVILSHCRYSLMYGRGHQIECDFPALERHILSRFVYGKPLIMLDIPSIVYKEDRYTGATFSAIRKKIPQDHLSNEIKLKILAGLNLTHQLRENLDRVEVVLRFLSFTGGNEEMTISQYAAGTLQLTIQLHSMEQCKLKHVISLWQSLSIKLFKQVVLNGQEPFDGLDPDSLDPNTSCLRTEIDEEQKTQLYQVLQYFDLDYLLGILYEFIETRLRHSPLDELKWPLVDTVEAFLEAYGIDSIPKLADIPNTIDLSQTISTWKHIALYQEIMIKRRHAH